MFLGAIADDLTGATDLALTLSRSGLKVLQVVGVPDDRCAFGDAEAVVVSLKSRTLPAADAVTQSVASARILLNAGAQQLFFKYCSTFDSTDEGNIGPVTDALMDLLGEKRTLACPAFPANGRTVYKGHLFVHDQLLSESPMRDHPLTPMRESNLVRVLQRQTRHNVELIPRETVAAGGETLQAAVDAVEGIAIIDAINDDDLHRIGKAAAGLKLITGGSAIAMGLPQNFRSGAIGYSGAEVFTAPQGRAVVLAGSCSAATRRQVEFARAAGHPTLRLDPLEIAEGKMTLEEAASFVLTAEAGAIPLVYSSDSPERVAAVQQALGRSSAGELIEHFLADLATLLRARGVKRFLVAGGETSGAIVAALGVTFLVIGPEIAPGVPWTLANGAEGPIALALKSGNFGQDDIFLTAWELLK